MTRTRRRRLRPPPRPTRRPPPGRRVRTGAGAVAATTRLPPTPAPPSRSQAASAGTSTTPSRTPPATTSRRHRAARRSSSSRSARRTRGSADDLKVLVFHGYLLRGTGSNVYNASLAQALARLGHEVHLLCQDRGAGGLPWVDRIGTWKAGELSVEPAKERPGAPHPGSVTAYVPDIGGLLPVYVFDRYEGFEVRTFPELGDAELEAYLAANVAAVRDVAAAIGGVEAALAN